MPMAISRVVPLNIGSTQNDPPNCWMPEIPTARIITPTMVPQTLTRPGLIVVDPRNAPTSAGSRNSSPTEACPIRSFEASSTPASAAAETHIDFVRETLAQTWDAAAVRWALMYPDAYEVGAPNQGVQILYEVINERDDALAERTYSVWPDLEALMRRNRVLGLAEGAREGGLQF
mgnify:CR=1 FL=1